MCGQGLTGAAQAAQAAPELPPLSEAARALGMSQDLSARALVLKARPARPRPAPCRAAGVRAAAPASPACAPAAGPVFPLALCGCRAGERPAPSLVCAAGTWPGVVDHRGLTALQGAQAGDSAEGPEVSRLRLRQAEADAAAFQEALEEAAAMHEARLEAPCRPTVPRSLLSYKSSLAWLWLLVCELIGVLP